MTPKTQNGIVDTKPNFKEDLVVTSGIRKYPTNRNFFLKNAQCWIDGKRENDKVFPYWRVHNKLYDLTDFISRHPGGSFWIEETRGTDITESFESSHFGTLHEKVLSKYYVKEINTPRNSSFTFHEDGFYKTLKKKVSPILKTVGTGPSLHMKVIQDSTLIGFLVFSALAAWNVNIFYAIIAGIFLNFVTIVAHNFFHQRDNWRMYTFDLSLNSSREWRISHSLSHHNYPNTIIDYEVSTLEPHLELLPKSSKSFFHRYAVLVTGSIFYAVGIYVGFVYKIILYKMGRTKFFKENLLPFLHLFFIIVLCGSLMDGLKIWLAIHTTMNFVFSFVGLTAAHHHPDIYHEGDKHPEEKDWGLHQVLATRERGELFMKNLFLTSISFGNHTLHHLFPTVDHSKLPYLQEVLLETCKEFGIQFEVYTPWKMVKGLYRQLALVKPNSDLPSILKKRKQV